MLMAGKVQTAARPSGQAKRPAMNQDIREQQMPKKKKKVKHFYDYSLLFCIIFLTAFGLVMIYSASSYSAQLNYKGNGAYFMERQAGIAAVGFVAMIIISKMDYHIFARFSVLAYLMSYILMIAVSFVGREVNGKRRWLAIGPLSFQPTEFVKIALIVMLAAMITTMGIKINKWRNMGYVVAMTLPIAGLVAMNNLSSGIIVCGIAFVMLFVACKVKWPFFTIGALGLGTLAFAGPIGKFLMTIKLLQPYQFRRIEAWLNPESDPTDKGFQVLQGLYAIGSGGLVGQGLGESIQKLGFLPESQNDMIFAIICEELGLFGAVSIILIFLFMIYRFMLIANNAPDLFGALLVVGVMGHIAIQVILNIAVVTNTIPNTGITLPFISYGGTSVLFLLMEMGVVLSVSNQIKLEK
jgi:cell division protein FtsW